MSHDYIQVQYNNSAPFIGLSDYDIVIISSLIDFSCTWVSSLWIGLENPVDLWVPVGEIIQNPALEEMGSNLGVLVSNFIAWFPFDKYSHYL